MPVTVKLFATLGKYLPPGALRRQTELPLDGAASVGDLLARLGVPRATVHLIMVNGIHGTWDSPVAEGDTVTVFPPVAGGC